MKRKQSNLILSLDVSCAKTFFEILDKTAKHIVMLKTHIDIIDNFEPKFIEKLRKYSQKFDFLIFEDRKFADIGSTVRKQYRNGIYRIADWAEFITVHTVAGEGIIKGLFDGISDRSCFLLARMSAKENLINETYTRKTIEIGRKNTSVVSGYIGHGKDVADIQRFKSRIPKGQLLLMPGVQLERGSDAMGQQYITVEEAVEGGADCVIVGRGIISGDNPDELAVQYQARGWSAYQKRTGQK